MQTKDNKDNQRRKNVCRRVHDDTKVEFESDLPDSFGNDIKKICDHLKCMMPR
jgi:hypothetical protein